MLSPLQDFLMNTFGPFIGGLAYLVIIMWLFALPTMIVSFFVSAVVYGSGKLRMMALAVVFIIGAASYKLVIG